MALSWNEVRNRARAFSKEFESEGSEDAEAKTFWDDFFRVFGVHRRRVASFEKPVKKETGKGGFIDLLWKGVLLVEHKSRGKDLHRAGTQAFDYFPGLKDRDLPRYVVVSDFARIRLYDLESDSGKNDYLEFPLKELFQHIKAFGFMMGMPTQKVKAEAPVNQKAITRLSELHDQLADSGYTGKDLEALLTRLVFCFFADDTSIFEVRQFYEWIANETSDDGSDVGPKLHQLFEVLDTATDKRSKSLSATLSAFEYVNGALFRDRLRVPDFTPQMRESLLNAGALGWSGVSPAIFGAMFQGLMSRVERRQLGAHYTRETNILRVIKPLFLDDLWAEFEASKASKKKLQALHARLRTLRFFDPACGCGNFLVVTYRELRLLELEILRVFYKTDEQQQMQNDIDQNVWLNVDQFHGIELDEKATHIAKLAMWLTDHQMNLQIGEAFGTYFKRLPLKTTANIVHANALRTDWKKVLSPTKETTVYVVGNPPFVGGRYMTDEQRVDADFVFGDMKNAGTLDLVAAWYVKAADYIAGNGTRCAFVSTNSITQGEQAGVLWSWLLAKGIKIHFAHRTFQWSNEARGKAAVHCVIVGFGEGDWPSKIIFEYDSIRGEPRAVPAKNINPYLVDYDDLVLPRRTKPLWDVPLIGIGSQPIEDGNYLFTPKEKADFLAKEPGAKKYFYRFIGSDEFLSNIERWCMWLGECPADELRRMPEVMKRVEAVRKFRAASKRTQTKEAAHRPTHFATELIPQSTYIVVPKVSSERREYLPLGFMKRNVLCSDLVFMIPDADLYHFGILSSTMHNAWMRYTCGRLKSDFRYSAGIVYNNYPWPDEPTDKKRKEVVDAAQKILDVRAAASGSLADVYDPLTMPLELRKAHRDLDKLVDKLYVNGKTFATESQRVAFLFGLYTAKAAPAAPARAKKLAKAA